MLLPVLVRHGGNLLTQHAEIRGLLMELSDEVESRDVRTDTLQAIGERLEEHIRLEEREVFPMLEESLPKEALEEFSDRLDTFESGHRTEPWVPSWGISYDPWPGPGDSEGGGSD